MSDTEIIDGEIVEEPGPDYLPVPASAAPAQYVPAFALEAAEAHDLVVKLREVQRSVLVAGTDYDTIPGTNKPSLLKPGAERLLQVFGLGHDMVRVEVERDAEGQRIGVTYRCVVFKNYGTDRIQVSSCEGYAGYDEDRFFQAVEQLEKKERANASRYRRAPKEEKWAEPFKAPWNSVVKMAQKRALVGAALQGTGASGLFTQDLEDHAPAVTFGSVVQDQIDTLDEVHTAALKEWWKGQRLPRVVDLDAAQAAQVLVQIGRLSTSEIVQPTSEREEEARPDKDDTGGEPEVSTAVTPAPPPASSAPAPDYNGRRAAAFAMLKAAGVTEAERKDFIRAATGTTDSTRQLSVEELRQIEEACERRRADGASPAELWADAEHAGIEEDL